ncbi:MAG: DUF4886 domain-containing protein [Clostridia bacterium]|nr:DUF4886 domain-containing protein [Clostridia bacterium]
MKRTLLLLLIAALVFTCGCSSSLPNVTEETPSPSAKETVTEQKTGPETEETLLDVSEISPLHTNQGWDGKTLKVLSVGNSFARNATKVLYQIAKREGVEEIVLGNLHIGGCPISRHYELSQSGSAEYAYYKNTTGTWEKTENVAMMTALLDEDWDYITITSTPGQEGDPKFYEGCLDGLIAFLDANKTNPEAKIAYHMTWAFPNGSPSSVMKLHNNSRTVMFNAITDTTENHILKKYDVDFLIASGTAVENARSVMGQVFTKDDGYHMNTAGEYVTGYMYFAAITGKPLTELKFTPNYISPESRVTIARAVNAALHDPFSATDLR